MITKRINLSTSNPTLLNLFAISNAWEKMGIEELSDDQMAVLNLKRIIEAKEHSNSLKGGGGTELSGGMCFICATGA